MQKLCKCGNEPIYKNGEVQICDKCLIEIWSGRKTLNEHLNEPVKNIYTDTKIDK